MPDADAREVLLALAGDLALVPWARDWRPASPRAFGDWRQAAGPEPLEELQAVVLGAAREEHDEHDWRAVVTGRRHHCPDRAASLIDEDTLRSRPAVIRTGPHQAPRTCGRK